MKPTFLWKNFKLGEELSVAGAFIYNGLRRFHELKRLDVADEIFEVFYHLSIGLERLMKIAIVLLEHDDTADQGAFEESLRTHDHQALLARIRKHAQVNLGNPHIDFLNMLARFYEIGRYDRFSLQSVGMHDREKRELVRFLGHQLQIDIEDGPLLGVQNDERYKKFLRNIVLKISSTMYELIKERAQRLGLYTYELRSGSKAETVFFGKADIPAENVLWKELLIFFMNTKESTGYLKFLRGIEPLPFDPADVSDFLDCFQSDNSKSMVMDQLESLYDEIPDKKERLQMIDVIGASGVCFDDEEVEDEDFDDEGFDEEEPDVAPEK